MKTVLIYAARPAKIKSKRTTKSPKYIICIDAKNSKKNRNIGFIVMYHVTKKFMLNRNILKQV